MKNKYCNGNFYEIEKSTIEKALVKMFSVDTIENLNLYWLKGDGDSSTAYTNISLEKITKNIGTSMEEILFINESAWDTDGEKRTKEFYNDLLDSMKFIDSSISISEKVWMISVTDESSINNFDSIEANKTNSWVIGQPKIGKYLILVH